MVPGYVYVYVYGCMCMVCDACRWRVNIYVYVCVGMVRMAVFEYLQVHPTQQLSFLAVASHPYLV